MQHLKQLFDHFGFKSNFIMPKQRDALPALSAAEGFAQVFGSPNPKRVLRAAPSPLPTIARSLEGDFVQAEAVPASNADEKENDGVPSNDDGGEVVTSTAAPANADVPASPTEADQDEEVFADDDHEAEALPAAAREHAAILSPTCDFSSPMPRPGGDIEPLPRPAFVGEEEANSSLVRVKTTSRKPRISHVAAVQQELTNNYKECPPEEWHERACDHKTLWNYTLESWQSLNDDRRTNFTLPEKFGSLARLCMRPMSAQISNCCILTRRYERRFHVQFPNCCTHRRQCNLWRSFC